ncbi:MAG TPA: nucleotidyltransferase family protein [Usitatibacter sp.]|nr:nucleotidyltransferase family protein [Usitatibacter sp.]
MTAETSDLLLACARSSLDRPSRRRIESALAARPDWDLLLALGGRHGLLPLMHRHLDAVEAVPAGVRARLWARREATLARNLARARELLEVTALFEAHGIASLPYKGPALAQALHGDVSMREFGDLDILVAPRDVPRARDLLAARGYRPTYALPPAAEAALMRSPLQYHLCLEHDTLGMIELHWKTDPDYPVERIDDPQWWGALATTPLLDESVRAFPDEELLAVLCIHGSKHHWTSLAWLVDVAELLRRASIDWERLFARAAGAGYERRLALGLMLAARWLDAPLPQALRSTLAARPDLESLARRVADGLFDPGYEAPATLDGLRFDLDLYESRARRLKHVAAHLASPNISDWTRWNLPRPLAFLYAPLRVMRLSAKYLLR